METTSRQWEDRFGEEAYLPLARSVFSRALDDAGITVADIDHLIVTGLRPGCGRPEEGLRGPGRPGDTDHAGAIGNLGAAQSGLQLADVLERASAGQVIVVVEVADGADAVVLRTTAALTAVQEARREAGLRPVAELVTEGRSDLPYAVFLSWRGQLHREPPRRPDPERPDAPASLRGEGWKFGFNASRCTACGFRHLPGPAAICLSCQAVDQMVPERMADLEGTVATWTIDHLAFTLSPPLVGAVIDFDGGGRYRGEMTDVDPGAVAVGTRVAMTFRRLYSADGMHNYFWKARPVSDGTLGGPGTPSHRVRTEKKEPWRHDQFGNPRPGGHRGNGLHPFRRALEPGTNDLLTDRGRRCTASAGVAIDAIDAFWLGTLGAGNSGISPSKP